MASFRLRVPKLREVERVMRTHYCKCFENVEWSHADGHTQGREEDLTRRADGVVLVFRAVRLHARRIDNAGK